MKQSSLDDNETLGMELDTNDGGENADDVVELMEYDDRRHIENGEKTVYNNFQMRPSTPTQLQQTTVQRGCVFSCIGIDYIYLIILQVCHGSLKFVKGI